VSTPSLVGVVKENCANQSDSARWAVLPMRLVIGSGFIEHGFAKLSKDSDAFPGMLRQLGVPLPYVAAWLTIGTEPDLRVGFVARAFVLWASIPTALVWWSGMLSIHLPYELVPLSCSVFPLRVPGSLLWAMNSISCT
jgi:uncharacterized membrane protein YphA (DoxX/SURF4 family)